MSKAARLGKTLGGKWTYHWPCHWYCDDGKRSVTKCSAGVDEFDNPVGPGQYWLYGDGEPRRAEQYITRIPRSGVGLSELLAVTNGTGERNVEI